MYLGKRLRKKVVALQARGGVGRAVFTALRYIAALTEILRARVYFFRGLDPTAYAPNFLCIGAQKSGTSWLDSVLRQHPDIAMPRGRKEVHYYTNGWWKGVYWYLWHFRGAQTKRRGDITPRYALLAPKRIAAMHALNPDAIVFFILRNPIERAWSMAYMDLVKAPGRRLEDVSEAAFSKHFRSAGSLERGRYSQTISRYRAVFRAEQVKILFYDDLVADAERFAQNVLTLIGADPERLPSAAQRHITGRANVGGVALPPQFHAELSVLYKDELETLRGMVAERYWPHWLRTGTATHSG